MSMLQSVYDFLEDPEVQNIVQMDERFLFFSCKNHRQFNLFELARILVDQDEFELNQASGLSSFEIGLIETQI